MGLPKSDDNIVSLVAFIGIEGTWPAGKNPLNTTLRMSGSTSRTPVGVQSYSDWATGLEANAKTLAQPNMHLIVEALRRSAAPHEFLQALSDSPWCSASSTVANRSPECTGNPNQGPCYCNYAKFDVGALYHNWFDRDDGSGTLTAGGTNWKLIGGLAAIISIGGGIGWWILTNGGRRSFRGALENPARRKRKRKRSSRKRGRGKGRVQSLLFPRSRFTPSKAKAWARAHSFKSGKVDVTGNYVRLRQEPPGKFGRMRTIQFKNTPVKAVVGFR